MIRHSVNLGDAKPLRWDLNRDLSDVTGFSLQFAKNARDPIVHEVTPAVDGDPGEGVIIYTLDPVLDFGEGKLTEGEWLVKVVTEPGPLTHPDDPDAPHAVLEVLPVFAPAVP